MSSTDLKTYVYDIMRKCARGVTPGGILEMHYEVHFEMNKRPVPLCYKAFYALHLKKHCYYEELKKKIKAEHYGTEKIFTDKSRLAPSFVKSLILRGGQFGIKLVPEQISALTLPNTLLALTTAAWMKEHFKLVGDSQPNIQQIQLEKQNKKPIHSEYVREFQHRNMPFVKYSTFCKIWRESFPYVTIRVYKHVCGKCFFCSVLITLRNAFKDERRKQLVIECLGLHRTTFMQERLAYHSRIEQARRYANMFWSSVSDGMAQNHTRLPHHKDQYEFKPNLPQHLQGFLIHGRMVNMYRTFHNVRNNANTAIHCFLLALEQHWTEHKRLPDVLYHQMDGGSENTAKVMISICELLVARRICKKIILSRLPVGHTHEDIDAIFALIWKNLMSESAITPEQFKELVLKSIGGKEALQDVIDIFVVPNYTKYLKPAADKKFGNYSKLDWTQLQIIFEATDVCEQYPCGVKINYRAYCSDTVTAFRKTKRSDGTNIVDKLIEKDPSLSYKNPPEDTTGIHIGADPNIGDNEEAYCIDVEEQDDIGFIPIQLHVKTYPLPDEPAVHNLGYVPYGVLEPDSFVDKSRELLDKVVAEIEEKYKDVLPTIVKEWKDFAAKAPGSNSSVEYCATHPMHIPFGEKLFPGCMGGVGNVSSTPSAAAVSSSSAAAASSVDRNTLNFTPSVSHQRTSSSSFPDIHAVTQPCVRWSNNGGAAINAPPIRFITRRSSIAADSTSITETLNDAERCMGESGWEYADDEWADFNDAASDHSSEADMPTDAMGWTSVHYRKSAVPRYGIAGDYIGRVFRRDLKAKELLLRQIVGADPFKESKVVDVVVKNNGESRDLYLKFCSVESISDDDPSILPEDPACYSYDLAKTMMSSSRSSPYKWIANHHENLNRPPQQSTRRQRRRTWAYVDQDGNEVDEPEFNRNDTEDEDDD